eukprot:Pgem_evm1s4665
MYLSAVNNNETLLTHALYMVLSPNKEIQQQWETDKNKTFGCDAIIKEKEVSVDYNTIWKLGNFSFPLHTKYFVDRFIKSFVLVD